MIIEAGTNAKYAKKGVRLVIKFANNIYYVATVTKATPETIYIKFDSSAKLALVHSTRRIVGEATKGTVKGALNDTTVGKHLKDSSPESVAKAIKRKVSTMVMPGKGFKKSTFKPDDRIIVKFDVNTYYLGTVTQVSNSKYQVIFDDGDVAYVDQKSSRIMGKGKARKYSKAITDKNLGKFLAVATTTTPPKNTKVKKADLPSAKKMKKSKAKITKTLTKTPDELKPVMFSVVSDEGTYDENKTEAQNVEKLTSAKTADQLKKAEENCEILMKELEQGETYPVVVKHAQKLSKESFGGGLFERIKKFFGFNEDSFKGKTIDITDTNDLSDLSDEHPTIDFDDDDENFQ